MKATFNVTLVHDPRLIALSNMPIYQSEVKDGWKYDHFEKTVKMSTYLAAFAVGDFKYKETKTERGIQVTSPRVSWWHKCVFHDLSPLGYFCYQYDIALRSYTFLS